MVGIDLAPLTCDLANLSQLPALAAVNESQIESVTGVDLV